MPSGGGGADGVAAVVTVVGVGGGSGDGVGEVGTVVVGDGVGADVVVGTGSGFFVGAGVLLGAAVAVGATVGRGTGGWGTVATVGTGGWVLAGGGCGGGGASTIAEGGACGSCAVSVSSCADNAAWPSPLLTDRRETLTRFSAVRAASGVPEDSAVFASPRSVSACVAAATERA